MPYLCGALCLPLVLAAAFVLVAHRPLNVVEERLVPDVLHRPHRTPVATQAPTAAAPTKVTDFPSSDFSFDTGNIRCCDYHSSRMTK